MAAVARPLAVSVMPLENRREQFLTLATLGERVPLAVAKEARALRLNVPPAEVPICLAAIGDASVRLAVEVADGWTPFLYPVRVLGQGLERLREGAARTNRPAPAVYPMIPASVDDDAAKARAGAAWLVSFYLTSMGTFYRDTLMRFGFDKEVHAVLAANAPTFAGAVPPEAEVLLDELIVYGTPAEARRRLARWYEAGAAMPGLVFRPNRTAEEPRRSLEAFVPMLESR